MNQVSQTTGYALWLMPSGHARRRLARRILALSRRYSTPRFDPHITLLSGITIPEQEALSRSATLAHLLQPFEVRLIGADSSDEYFRCLFFRVLTTDAVTNAHQRAREVFRLQNQPPYMPHLSLLYGRLPMSEKRKIASVPPANLVFEASQIHLYSVTGAPSDWRRTGTFSLR